jgi:hypothetical protein
MPEKKSPKLIKWMAWQEKILDDVIRLHGSKQIYYEYVRIIELNRSVKDEGILFHNWIVDNWVTFTAMTIRRQADRNPYHKDAISLGKLIDDIGNNPTELTREFHISLYTQTPEFIRTGVANATFTKQAGSGKYFDAKIAQADLAKLETTSRKVQDLATLSIAHHSKKPLPKLTFDEVNQCIDVFKELTQKYVLLLTAGWNLVDPVMDYWQGIFTRSWIGKKDL